MRYTEPDGIELYHLHKDPSEMYNRAEEFPDMAQALLEEMREFAREAGGDIYEEGNQR